MDGSWVCYKQLGYGEILISYDLDSSPRPPILEEMGQLPQI